VSIIQDLRYAVRSFARTPGVTVLALLTIAIGIGANAAIFSVIHSVLIAPVPYPHPERVVVPWRHNPQTGLSISASAADIDRWSSLPPVEAVTSYTGSEMVLTGGAEPESVQVTRVAPTLFDFVGAQPAMGRRFSSEEAVSDAAGRVVMLTDAAWRTRFGARRDVLGERIVLDDQSHEIVGVLRPNFYLPLNRIDIVAPLPPALATAETRPDRIPAVLMRLRPGVSIEAAEAAFVAAGVDTFASGPAWSVKLMRPMDLAGDAFRRALYVLLGAVAFVLLIACANVANVVLARNAARRREIAVRVALGASRGRLVRQLLAESMLLAVAGGALGLALGTWGVQAIAAMRPPELRELQNVRVSPAVFAFGFAVTLLTGLLFGLLPAFAAARTGAGDALKQGLRSIGGGRARLARRALTVAEMALAIVLLVGAGLLIRSYDRLQRADLGFDPERVLALRVSLPEARYPTAASRADFVAVLTEQIRALPGVRDAAVASGLPPRGGILFGQLEIEGLTTEAPPPSTFGGGWVMPGYFETMRMPILDGRSFHESDVRSGEVMIVNESLARRYWPDESAVGKRIRLNAKRPWATIVGVVGDVTTQAGRAAAEQIYEPMTPVSIFASVSMVIATTADPAGMAAAVKGQVWTRDAKLPLRDLETLEQRVASTLARPRFNLVLLSVFAGVGLLLAAIGVYGVISYSVGLRRQEIGVRMALGAQPRDIRRDVMGEAVKMAAVGVALGLAGAAALTKLLGAMLHEVSPTDPATFGAVAAMLAATALLAAWVPARRAMRVDPMVALRDG
jgi:putative ABC transport system permease protein